jgi:F-type H+-transporting ATPase subunit delta
MTPNPRLAARYAKAVLDLAIEKGQLEEVYKDMLLLKQAFSDSRDLVTLLRSPIIKADKKGKVLDAITAGKITAMTTSFYKLLLAKEREAYFPEIVTAFIEEYKIHKGIHTVRLTTAAPVSEELKQSILGKIREAQHFQQVELQTAVDESLIGGFVLEADGQRVDASIAFELHNIKKQFQNNDFIYKIR